MKYQKNTKYEKNIKNIYIFFICIKFLWGIFKKQWSMLGSFIIIKKVIVNITLKAKMLLL
jgi:hypothetical protein